MHDFKNFPELRDEEFDIYYWESPHRQITEDFDAVVEKVHDGDTVTLSCDFRDFKFPLRISYINAPELNQPGGTDSRDYLKNRLEGKIVRIIINKKNRVEKWGRLLGDILHAGVTISKEMVAMGFATEFERRNLEGFLPSIDSFFNPKKWL